jgi:hypothetical protein
LFNPDTLEFCGFLLVGGVYEAMQPNEVGHLWSQQLELFLGTEGNQLRFFTPDGELVPTPHEAAQQAQQQADRFAHKLRELGVDPDTV